ncbi:MAG: hypothetical protein J2P25_24200, partial [Nocardiopsaceae bacterium]|nr:hypothetical protein [Nocardiopsaceae bacterium]
MPASVPGTGRTVAPRGISPACAGGSSTSHVISGTASARVLPQAAASRRVAGPTAPRTTMDHGRPAAD